MVADTGSSLTGTGVQPAASLRVGGRGGRSAGSGSRAHVCALLELFLPHSREHHAEREEDQAAGDQAAGAFLQNAPSGASGSGPSASGMIPRPKSMA